jgi:hypothetical protein
MILLANQRGIRPRLCQINDVGALAFGRSILLISEISLSECFALSPANLAGLSHSETNIQDYPIDSRPNARAPTLNFGLCRHALAHEHQVSTRL